MPSIRDSLETVYYAPTVRRRFFTLRAACHREAAAMILRKYPSEQNETDSEGRDIGGGYHWTEDERLGRVHERLARMLAREYRRHRKYRLQE